MLPDVDERRRRARGVRAFLASSASGIDGVVGHGQHTLENATQIAHVEDVVEPARRIAVRISARGGRAAACDGRRASCPPHDVVGGFFCDFEAIRSTSLDSARTSSNSKKKPPPASCDGHKLMA